MSNESIEILPLDTEQNLPETADSSVLPKDFVFRKNIAFPLYEQGEQEDSDITSENSATANKSEKTTAFENALPRRIPTVQEEDVRKTILKHFTGEVTSSGDDFFIARLTEKGKAGPAIEAEFAMEELSPEDQAVVDAGVPLVWIIGYDDTGGPRKRLSELYVRRVPPATWQEIQENQRKLDSVIGELFSHSSS